MSADVLPFPAAPRVSDPTARPRLAVGDMVVTCINQTLGIWCAWPVAVVDDDGVVIGVLTRAGKMLGVDRVNCLPDVYGFTARNHQGAAFTAMRWRTWRDLGEALSDFAGIGLKARP